MKGSLSMAHILVADSYLAIGLLYREVLQDQGHAVSLAMSGREACLLGLKQRFDIAIVDDRLPDFDPEELLGELRRHQPRIRGILCVSSIFGPRANPGLWDGTFNKNHDFRILEAVVARICRQSSSLVPTPLQREQEYNNEALCT
jgi:CheY-like chemotaxis protein